LISIQKQRGKFRFIATILLLIAEDCGKSDESRFSRRLLFNGRIDAVSRLCHNNVICLTLSDKYGRMGQRAKLARERDGCESENR